MTNIFIEGMQGSGKTTLMRSLHEKLNGYHMYLEGDISPVELSWCSYMTEEEYQQALAAFPDLAPEIEKYTVKEESHFITAYTRIITDVKGFHQYMEQYEIYGGRRSFDEFKNVIFSRLENFHGTGNLFECSFFQNIIEELMLYYCKSEEEILDFYRELFTVIKQKSFKLLYLCSDNIEGDVLRIKKERADENGVEMWFPLMMKYLNASPYGKKCEFVDMSHMIAHFRRRRDLELRIMKEILGEHSIILPSKAYDIGGVVKGIGNDITRSKTL
ncbi:hypothetical protein [Lacrimispora indolis]|uniref:hypothetical protein n=1 Tax=Lacrimispora indolis TaxID=69825 RepID=UPI00045E6A0C|nr:hypothetical protein [Lacrimispora indolis]